MLRSFTPCFGPSPENWTFFIPKLSQNVCNNTADNIVKLYLFSDQSLYPWKLCARFGMGRGGGGGRRGGVDGEERDY